jgi:hypothetical protein
MGAAIGGLLGIGKKSTPTVVSTTSAATNTPIVKALGANDPLRRKPGASLGNGGSGRTFSDMTQTILSNKLGA